MSSTSAARPLRLALVCDWYAPRLGGIETHVAALAEQLARAGHAVDVLTTTPPTGDAPGAPAVAPPAATLDAPAATFGRVRVHRLPLPLLPHYEIALAPRRTGRLVREALRAGGYDLVHAHASVISPLAFAGARAAHALGLPCVLTHHSVLGGATRAFAAADRVLRWSRWRVLHSAVSPLVAGELQAAAPALDVRVLPNGIHAEEWPARHRAPRRDGTLRVVSVMRLAPRKRALALVEIVARAAAALPAGQALEVRIAGDGPERAAVAREIRRRGLQDTIVLLGWQSRAQVRALFADADAFVLPSILESFGIAALEARCAGLPVVALRRAGPAAFVRHGVEGLLADDDADLAAQLVRLATDDRLRAAIARHNRTTRPTETWDAVLARHEALYAEARQVARAPRRGRVAVVAGAGAVAAAVAGAVSELPAEAGERWGDAHAAAAAHGPVPALGDGEAGAAGAPARRSRRAGARG